MTGSIRTSIIINAAPAKVRDVILDFEKYAEWNPFILSISSDSADKSVGSHLKVTVKPPNRDEVHMTPHVTDNSPELFAWRGKFYFNFLFTGRHVFEFKQAENGHDTEFLQWEEFSGILLPFVGGVLRDTEAGFKAMNEALKQRVESL
ncbi:SRPBCC domain-containing protein [Lipomyces japonicus]|uniref:SRPBCC domain-containing protein n=1 Tax=Lipomyces japonicus TaxID=56871 RepID=UPI0034CFA153